MKRLVSFLLFIIATTCGFAPNLVLASSGFYISGELGANFAPGLETTGFSNDRASVCDQYINPRYNEVEKSTEVDSSGNKYSAYNCTGPNRGVGDDWQNEFDGATGILAGAAVGYSFSGQDPNQPWSGFRVELEYLYRDSKYDQASDLSGAAGASLAKSREEIVVGRDQIGSITSHDLFGNLYFDFINRSRFIPYVGVGIGVGFTDVDYGYVWARNFDEQFIKTGAGLPNENEIRKNLAGTVSTGQTTLRDTLLGFQVLFGVDYAVTETMSLGLKGRWVNFDTFRGEAPSGLLRSHVPNLRLDGSEPVSGGIKTDDIEFFGVSVNLKYHF